MTMRFRFAKWACDRLTEDADSGKKKSFFQMKLILILAAMKTSKIVAFGAQKTRTHTLKSRRTQNESLFGGGFWSRGIIQKIEDDIGNIWFQQDGATYHTAEANSMFCALFLKIALSAAELMSFGHLGAAI